MTLFPVYGETHAIWNDPYVHATSFAAFLFGFAIAKSDVLLRPLHALPLARAGDRRVLVRRADGLEYLCGSHERSAARLGHRVPRAATRSAGVEARSWRASVSPTFISRTPTMPRAAISPDAIFPFYIVHQTAIVVFAYNLARLNWPLWIEAPVLIALTVLACFGTYELVRRVPLLRPWFGLGSKKSEIRANHLEAGASAGHVLTGWTDTA